MDKPTHFTYEVYGAKDDLYQGDILEPTKEVRSIFKDIHPHFLDAKYNAFLLLTQTCDLVRRNDHPCKSRYVNLAIIRPLEDVLRSFLDRVCKKARIQGKPVKGLYIRESKGKAKQFLQRVLNQNEQAMGIFYFHPDQAVRITVHSVALLQVSVAVRAQEHYDTLVKARCGRLKDPFRNKLGWLIGNLFSRVATDDMSAELQKTLIYDFLNSNNNISNPPKWVSRESVELANKKSVDITSLPSNEILALLEQHKREPHKSIAIGQVLKVIQQVVDDLPAGKLNKIKNLLSNDPHFAAACK